MNDFDKPPSDGNLPQGPPTTSPPGVRIEGGRAQNTFGRAELLPGDPPGCLTGHLPVRSHDMDAEQKVREAKLRRMAERQGLHLQRSRRRDRLALDYDGYQLIDPRSNALVFGELARHGFGATLDDIEVYLKQPRADRRPDRAVNNGQSTAVIVEWVQVPEWANDLLLRRRDEAELLVLPQRVRDGRGEYRDADLQGVRALHAAGVRVDWAHGESDRTFISEYGAGEVGAVGMFVAQALAQENIGEIYRWLLARVRQALGGHRHGPNTAPFVIEVDRVKIEGTRREIEGLRVTGHDERVVDVAIALIRGEPPPK